MLTGETVVRIARETRAFASERPASFALVFAPGVEVEIDPEALGAASAGLIALTGRLAGPEHALQAARTVTAWATGFIGMERTDAFRLGSGGSEGLDEAFEYGIRTIVGALGAPHSAAGAASSRGRSR
ncbi:TetR-like C-terminal domain-containing protein [Agromyces archimandritae]|uniref:WHG domain-containing protein n=1 Tax=Agromyces archimandritae TaxID=2781962 RepID=A0A975FND9_9MICO|nr:TetR-like C-terminal domain-containing protein [Agromyces archimandritae]QTX05052.1 WHG domain-containing protein [Agromyces archimandritae]